MMPISKRSIVLASISSTVVAFFLTALPAAAQQIDLDHWRKAYADSLVAKNGWLALVALDWLQEGDSSFGSAPDNKIKLLHVPAHLGVLRMHDGRVTLLPSQEAVQSGLLLDGKPATESLIGPDDSGKPSEIVSGDVRMTLIHRGKNYYLRVKDAESPTRVHFRGLNWYPPKPALRVTATWVPFESPKTLHIVNVLGQMTDAPSPGYAEFQIDGQTVRLEPTVEGRSLFFDFRDSTSKTTTDGAGRFLNTDLPSNGISSRGTLVLDFNYAHNPPCGYTHYATCPLPTPENRLTVAIPAGEKRYGDE